jgi:hypothetical protein
VSYFTQEQTMTTASATPTPAPQAAVEPTGCCLPFDPAPWQDREIVWAGKPFVKDHVRCMFHVPLNMGQTVMKDMALIERAHAAADHPLMLSDDESPWGENLYIEVRRHVPQASMTYISGRFLTKVFEGPFRNAGHWAREMKQYVAAKGLRLDRLYFGYTTCPKCAKAYGKNYVVLFAGVKENSGWYSPDFRHW